MKKRQILLAIALAFSMGLSMPVATFADEGITTSPSGTDLEVIGSVADVYNYKGMLAALANTDITSINVMADFTTTATLKVTRSMNINLNGHTITTANPNNGKYRGTFTLKSGNITIENGVIAPEMGAGVTLDTYEASDKTATDILTVNIASNVTINSPNYYGITILDTSYGTKLNFAGTINSLYGIANNGADKHTTNHLQVNIQDGASITAQDAAAYIPGYSEWSFGKAELKGSMGVGIKSGVVTMNGTTINATGDASDPIPWAGGINSTGAAIQLEEDTKYAGGINLTIDGGEYSSKNNAAIVQYQATEGVDADNVESIVIKDGTFTGESSIGVFAGVPVEDVTIDGGRFNSDISEYTGDTKFVEVEIDGEKVWVTEDVAADLNKPTEPSNPGGPTTPSTPEDSAELQAIRSEVQAYVDKINADKAFSQYKVLVKAVRQAEARVKNWGVTAMTSSEIMAKTTTGYDASLIVALGSDTKLGENLPADITKADLETAIKEAKDFKNYETYATLLEAVEDAEKALADKNTTKDELKTVLARLNELSKAEDPADPAKPIIPGVSDINSSNGSAGGEFTGAGAPDTGTTGLNDSIRVSAITCVVSGVLLAAAIIARRVYGKRKADKAEREFVKL